MSAPLYRFQCTAIEQPRSGMVRVKVDCAIDGETIREEAVFKDADKAFIFVLEHWLRTFS
ncbi:hypothetical protein ACEK07_46680 [Alcanivoracaceae bacterium MT1]